MTVQSECVHDCQLVASSVGYATECRYDSTRSVSGSHRYFSLVQCFPDTALALAQFLCDRSDRETVGDVQPKPPIDLILSHGLLAHREVVVGQ